MKEMVGGCCVCSDERGWPENPLVYCDGQNCTVAVHQACYGIVTVPTGPWYCRKCESQERSTRVRCELCPSRDGALKKTDNQGWAHVVCALYIPEVRFGNVTTMEPIILQLIPQERYAKTCYICQEIGKPSRATVGACMQCNKSNCKQQFHVTCAQSLGLLCEEAGNYLDNVKYCGYCQHHYSKLKKGGNVKTIPPYKPINHGTSSDSASSPEKEIEATPNATSSSTSATSIKITTNVNQSSSTIASTKQRKSNVSSKQSTSSSSSSSTSTTSSISNSGTSNVHGLTTANNNGTANINLSNSAGNNSISTSNTSNTGIGSSVGSGAGTSSTSNSKTPSTSSSSYKEKDKHSKSITKVSSSSKDKDSSSSSSSSRDSREKSSKSSKNKESSNTASTTTISNAMPVSTTVTAGSEYNSVAGAQHSNSSTPISTSTNASGNLGKDMTKSQPLNVTNNFTFGNEHHAANTTSTFNAHTDTVSSASSTSFANSTASSNNKTSSSISGSSIAKKRKTDSKTNTNEESNSSFKDIIKDVTVALTPLPQTDFEKEIEKSAKKQKTELSTSSHHAAAGDNNSSNTNSNSSLSTNASTVPATVAVVASSTLTTSSSSHRHVTDAKVTSNVSITSTSQANPSSISHATKSATAQSASSKDHHRTDDRYAVQSTIGTNSGMGAAQQGAVTGVSATNLTTTSTPSLYVSVPLSTANVPGISLPPTTIVHNADQQQSSTAQSTRTASQQQQQQQQQQAMSTLGNTPIMSSAAVPMSGSVGGTNSGTLERQSPRVHQQASVLPEQTNNNFTNIGGNMQSPSMHGVIHQSGKSPSPSIVSSSNLTATTTESGNLKISCEKQTLRVTQLQEQESAPVRRSRTPDSGVFSSSPFNAGNASSNSTSSSLLGSIGGGGSGSGGLKFTYEPQPGGVASVTPPTMIDVSMSLATSIKESPPSSPNSETSSVRKRGRKAKEIKDQGGSIASDVKDVKVFHNGSNSTTNASNAIPQAAHMLGNQINPTSSAARKLSDQLHMEMQDHNIYTPEVATPQFIGVPFPGKMRSAGAATSNAGTPTGIGPNIGASTGGASTPIPNTTAGTNSFASMFGGNVNGSLAIPQSLEQLLERQWEQGSQFLMEQAQHFDIASLLSCLHQLQAENSRLEEHVTNLIARRDHLLAVNARLAIPLNNNTTQSQAHIPIVHLLGHLENVIETLFNEIYHTHRT